MLNGLWQLGWGFQLSGTYLYGSGQRFGTTTGLDLRQEGGFNTARLRANGSIIPRNSFLGQPIHRLDLRILRKFPLGRGMAMDGMLEMFNVFNNANRLTTNESIGSANFGFLNIVGEPRQIQLGVRYRF